MMPEILTESFCERCGTRYTFEATAPVKAKKLGRFKTLSKGLKNYVLSDETSMDEAMAAARSDEERELTSHQLEAFQSTFNFCMTCRQYTCANCWNAAEGACLTCAPLNGYVTPSTTFLDLAPLVPIEPPGVQTSPWPMSDVSRESAAAEAATPWPDNGPTAVTPPLVEAPVEAASLSNAAIAWPIEAEQAATAEAAPQAVSEPEPVTADAEPVAEPVTADAEPVAEPVTADAEPVAEPVTADWAMAEAEASEESQPEFSAEIHAVAEPTPEPVEAPAAAVDEVAVEPDRAHVDSYAFESDIAPAIAELPDTDLRAADAARRTSDLLARLRPAASTPSETQAVAASVAPEPIADELPADEQIAASSIPTETPIVEMLAETTAPTEEPVPALAEFSVSEFDVADYVIADYEVADLAPEEPAALESWPEEPAAALPAELLAIIGPPIEAAPEPAVEPVVAPLEVAAQAEAIPAEAVAEPAEAVAAELAEPAEPATAPVDPGPEPVRADVVEQPTWRIVAPDPNASPTNGHTPHPEPTPPAVVAKAPAEPSAPVEPQWPTPPAPLPLEDAPYLVSRRTSEASEGLWAASARGVVAVTPGAPVLAIQTCGSCGLSLSATARFCRRCGTRQDA